MTDRLPVRLLLSHTVPLALVLVALLAAMVSLVALTSIIGEVREEQLVFAAEDEVHRAAWRIEVEARHGIAACEANPARAAEVAALLREANAGLADAIARAGPRLTDRLRRAAGRYLEYGEQMAAAETCARLCAEESNARRMEIDEELTTAWSDRVREHLCAIREDEARATALGARAIVSGSLLGVVSLAAAILVARGIARSVTIPLTALAEQARRMGEGDFGAHAPLRGGPREVRDLDRELDRMRARLSEVERLKQAFFASVSHDLRTPLGRIREALALLADGSAGPLGDQQRRIVSLARSACEREIRLVWAVLDLTRFQSGRQIRRDVGCSIDQVVATAVDDMRAEADVRGVRVSVEAPGRSPVAALDAALVERAIGNLLANAVSVSPQGGEVLVRRELVESGPVRAPADGVHWVRVAIRDRGPGVPDSVRPHLFEPFHAVNVAAGTDRGGLGLGLAVARAMVVAHGGTIELDESGPGGSTFSVWIPLEEPPGAAATRAPAGGAAAAPALVREGGVSVA